MFGLNRRLRAKQSRALAIAMALATISGLAALTPSAAHAAGGCTDSWTNTAGGEWFTGSNWSTGAPPTSTEEACITANGTYTVTMTQTSTTGTVVLRSLTIGGESGTQTLVFGSSCSLNAVLNASSGVDNTANGAIVLTNGEGCGTSVTLTAPLINAGTVTTEPAHGGNRQLRGGITNTGTLAINANTAYNLPSATLTNEGKIAIAEGIHLTVSEKASVTNSAGGNVASTGSGYLYVSGGGTFTEGAGTTSGSQPVIVDKSALAYLPGGGASQIALRGTSSLSGSSSAGQNLSLQSTCSEHAVVSAPTGFANGGNMTLTNGDGCGDNATLEITTGALTNTGKIVSDPNHGGLRQFQGNVVNKGILAVNANTSFNDATSSTLTNEGAIDVAEGKQLTLATGNAFVNGAGGSIVAGSGGYVLAGSGSAFTEGAGTTSGLEPVIVDDATLDYTGSGASAIALRGTSSLAGNIAAEQALTLQSTCSEHAIVSAAESFTNAGTITLTNGDGCGNNETLTISSGTLTNSGKIITQPLHGGTRNLVGNLTNTGTITLNATTAYPGAGALLLNEGTINLSEGVQLTVTGPGTVTDAPGGAITAAGTGALVQTGGTYNQGLGSVNGPEPVILDDATLNYTEHGAGKIALRGTSNLSGTVRSGETLLLQSTCSQHAIITAAGSFANNGVLEMTNGDGCGDNVTLNLKAGTLTNNSTLSIDEPHGGTRTIEGNLTNDAVLGVAAGEKLQVTGNYTQGSAGKFKTFIVSSSDYGTMSVGGASTLSGGLVLRPQGTFKATLGQTYPIITSSTLSGAFATEVEAQINYTGLYYKPTYAASGVTLVATQATQVHTPKSGPPSTVVTITGSGYLPGDTITPSFTDHGATVTTFPSVTTDSSGEFTAEVTIPSGAALGTGTLTVTSAESGIHISQSFAVT
jgi:fibronectin-binding autotransporter adhesin